MVNLNDGTNGMAIIDAGVLRSTSGIIILAPGVVLFVPNTAEQGHKSYHWQGTLTRAVQEAMTPNPNRAPAGRALTPSPSASCATRPDYVRPLRICQ